MPTPSRKTATTKPIVIDFFDDEDDDVEDVPPLEFSIRFKTREKDDAGEPTGKWVTQTADFEAYGEVPAGVTMNLLAGLTQGGGAMTAETIDYFKGVMPPEQADAFFALLHSPDNKVRMEHVSKTLNVLLETYARRPTTSS